MEKKYNVTNRSNSQVIYTIPEINLRREYAPGETKKIGFEELEKLSFRSGGSYMLANFLMVEDADALEQLNMNPEREYFMDKDQVAKLLLTGSMDEFLDCLDFAPTGVIELIKDLSVSLPLNDMAKRQAITEKTGFNVTKAIENSKEDDKSAKDEAPKRRVQPEKEEGPKRRVSGAPQPFEKYKNVTILED